MSLSARDSGTVWVTVTYAGKKGIRPVKKPFIKLKAGPDDLALTGVSASGALKSRRATIKIAGWGGLAAGMPQPSTVLRAIILR